jgi:membrane-associated phospholipid phosphatase
MIVHFRFMRGAAGTAARLVLVWLALGSAPGAAAQERRPDLALWGVAGAVTLGAFAVDERLRPWAGEAEASRRSVAAHIGNMFGRPQVAAPVLAGVLAVGAINDDRALVRGVLHTGGGLLASGVVNGAMKAAVGRGRPDPANDARRFRPLNSDDRWHAFPSGHTTVAFSLATAISMEARTPWVSAVSYGSAGLVAWSRLYSERHWASDVAGGAAVGILVTRGVVERLQARGSTPVLLSPVPGGVVLTLPTP